MGNVYTCRHSITGSFFAIKKIKKKLVIDIGQFISSIKIHSFFRQPNIVQLYSVFHDAEFVYLLMELCIDGNLKTVKKSMKTVKDIKKTVLGIAYGLRHLHKRGVRHGDIKLENVIYSWVIYLLIFRVCPRLLTSIQFVITNTQTLH